MLKACETCGWVQRSTRASAVASRCLRCGRPTTPLRYEVAYGPVREYRAGAARGGDVTMRYASGTAPGADSQRC
jgi:hypothetical protein